MFKQWVAVLGLTVVALSVALPESVEARRLGGGKASGMQRQMPAKPADATPATPGQAAPLAPKQAAAPSPTTPAAAPKRSWLGPIAGIAAGLGIAALMSHLGMGEAFGNFLTMALLALVAVVAIRWLMGRFAGSSSRRDGPQLAGAGAPWQASDRSAPTLQPANAVWRDTPPAQRTGDLPSSAVVAMPAAPTGAAASGATDALAGFDAAAFERVAKLIFVRMQAANDAGDLEDLRKFTTPELFASLRLDLQDRGEVQQQTDVVQLKAQVLDTAVDGDRHIVSVRFDGLIREDIGAAAVPFDEVWHLSRPADGSRDWAIAGITPTH